ncbi:MAG TPA: aldehyde dehydrogenase family protein [Atopostipes sp.]|nr:aldehyde dehydrogenase family protein [Atopostipes sp.]
MDTKKLYINGEWVDSTGTETTDVINPATEEVIATVAIGTNEDVDKAVAAAKAAFPTWNTRPVEERIEYMEKFYDKLEENKERIMETIIKELGSSRQWTEKGQFGLPFSEVRAAIDEVKKHEFEYMIDTAQIIEEGYGVVAAITPWNYPLLQIERKIVPAFLAGNTAVLKPASETPLTAQIVADLLDEIDLPKGVFNLVTGKGSTTGDYLAGHEDVDVISFTGSTAVGSTMYEKAADGIKQVVLELGGKSPLIFLEGGDLEAAAKQAFGTVLNNTGQTCTALTRLIVPTDRLEETKELLKEYNDKSVVVGDPEDEDTVVGPLISESQRETVLEYIEKGKEEGAEILFGGNKMDGKGFYVEPTVFVNVTNDMTIAQEEIFGPVLTVLTYDSVEEAIEIGNDSIYGLSGAVVGPEDEAKKVARQLRTGHILVNGAGRIPNAPFGGYKQSGRGRENGIYGVEDYLEIKAIFL